MKKYTLFLLLTLSSGFGFAQVKPLVVKNELPASVIVYLNQVIEGKGTRSSMFYLDTDEIKIIEVQDINSTVNMRFKEGLEKIPVNNNAYKRQLKSSKGDCVVCVVKKILENPVSGVYYFHCKFKSGLIKEFEDK